MVDVAAKTKRRIEWDPKAEAIVGDEDPNVGPFMKISGYTYISICSASGAQNRDIRIGGITRDARTRIISYAFEKLRRFLIRNI